MTKQLRNKIPQIRFRGFDDKWEEKPIGKVLTETKRSVVLEDNQRYELVTVRRRNGGVVSRGYLLGREILVKNYSQLESGDFIISKRQVVHGATGLVPRNLDKAIVSNEYLVAVGNDKLSTEFLTILSSLPDMRQKFFLSSYGVDIEKLFFDTEDWKKRTVTIPKVSEQTYISAFFKELDRVIELHQHKHNKLVTLKQAMLQKMFPQDGATTPEVRFKGFDGDWVEKKLGNLGAAYSGLSGKTKEDFGHGAGQYVTYMNVFSNTIADSRLTEAVEIDTKQNQVRFGDVFFTVSSETLEEVGMSSVWLNSSSDTYLNSFCFGFRPVDKIDPYFLAYILRAPDFRKSVVFLGQGISRYNISKRKTLGLSIRLPSLPEQQKIGAYLYKLESLILHHSTQLDKLKQIKSAFLEKMFV